MVCWQWGRGEGRGVIAERFDRRVERTIKGSRIVRNMRDGRCVLKLASELTPA
ncbi:MAG: DUF2945 domain-containing protein [Sphingopyxis terrae]|nr:DUF2945 domain-containing protein [Sphingopyxis terrae]